MPLLKNNAFIHDEWINAGLDDALPEGDVIVPFARLLKEFNALSKRNRKLGVVFPNVERAEVLRTFLPALSLIVLSFPSFTDGRAYSIARQLREMGFSGELRAAGNVLPDQIQFMRQVGFDAFEVSDRFPPALWLRSQRQMSLAYQRGLFRASGEAEVWGERHGEAAPWFEQPFAG
jgi:uncharacterized protein (DUF934 family)